MRTIGVVCALGLAACSGSKPAPPPPMSLVMPGSRLLYNNGTESVWSICDRATRVYMSNKGAVVVVPNGCLDGQP